MSIFHFDGKLYRFLVKFWNIIWIGVLWIVFSIPVFTIGSASSAAYYAMMKAVRKGFDRPTHDFIKSFKENFKQGSLLTVIYGIIGALFVFAFLFYYHQPGDIALGMRWLFLILLLLYVSAVTICFIWLSRFVITIKRAITYPMILAVLHLKQTFGLVIFWIASAVILYWTYNTPMFLFLLIFLPGFKCYADTFVMETLLMKYEPIAEGDCISSANGSAPEVSGESEEKNETLSE